MKIGILQTGHAPEQLYEAYGHYGAMFERWLGGRGFDFHVWDVLSHDFPDAPDQADGWLITGSKFGVYEDHAWIPPLEQLIRGIYASGKPMIGVCFGHQIIAQALGGRAEKFSGGWSVGPVAYDFQDRDQPVMIHAWHQDQVTQLPEGAQRLASTNFCENAAFVMGDKVLCVQPHPEFDDGFVTGLAVHRAPGVVPEDQRQAVLRDVGTELSRAAMADRFERFFKAAGRG